INAIILSSQRRAMVPCAACHLRNCARSRFRLRQHGTFQVCSVLFHPTGSNKTLQIAKSVECVYLICNYWIGMEQRPAVYRDNYEPVPWAGGARIMVCVGYNPTSQRLIERAGLLARALGGELI